MMIRPRPTPPPTYSGMLSSLNQAITRYLRQFIHYAVLGQSETEVIISHRLIYVPPSRQGYLLCMMLFIMLLGSMNYSNSMGFMFTFLIGSTALVSILHSYRNLSKLHLRAINPSPVYVGDMAAFAISIKNSSNSERYALCLDHKDATADYLDIPARQEKTARFQLKATHRGDLIAGRCQLSSRFPLGLVTSRIFIDHQSACLVYPQPAGNHPLPEPVSSSTGEHAISGEGADDFLGFREYQPGDSARHIYWKAAAHENHLLVKQFASQGPAEIWLDPALLPDLGLEARLSQLCKWVLDAESAGLQYGLHLPGADSIPPASGAAHKHACLALLARYQLPDSLIDQ